MIDLQNTKEWLNKNILLEIDLETTGVDSENDEIVEISYFLKKGTQVLIQKSFKIKTYKFHKKTSDQKRIIKELLGYDIELEQQSDDFLKPSDVLKEMVKDFKAVKIEDSKFYIFGYNVEFDVKFLIIFFKQYGTYEDSIFNFIHPERKIDVMYLLPFIEMSQNIKFKYYKLEYIRRVFKLEVEDHNATEDIIATKKLYKMFFEKLFLK